MKLIRTTKYLLQPTSRQRVKLDHLLWMQRKLYNQSLEERNILWRTEQKFISKYDQYKNINGMSQTNPKLAQYGTVVARGTLDRLDKAFKAFYRRCKQGETPGYPRFKGRYRWDSVSYQDVKGWKLAESNRLYLQGIGHIKAKCYKELPGIAKTCTVKRQGKKWWVIIVCDKVTQRLLPATNQEIGIDLGIAQYLTTSNHEHIPNPRYARKAEIKLTKAQQALSQKPYTKGTPSSKRRRKAVERVASHHRKVANCRRDYAHKVSRKLIDKNDLVAHEDLRIINMMKSAKGTIEKPGINVAQKRGLNRSIQDVGWGQLLQFISYKAEEAGREVIKVDPRNTSRTCSQCGHCEKANRQTQAAFRCRKCNYTENADINAAKNILKAGQALRGKPSCAAIK